VQAGTVTKRLSGELADIIQRHFQEAVSGRAKSLAEYSTGLNAINVNPSDWIRHYSTIVHVVPPLILPRVMPRLSCAKLIIRHRWTKRPFVALVDKSLTESSRSKTQRWGLG
jgi:hypothetical protein